MAKQTITKLIDDLTGDVANDTIEFGLDGVNYTIDLSDANAMKLRLALADYVAKGTRINTGRIASRGAAVAATSAGRKAYLANVRAWAEANGYDVAARGRISADVITAYEAGTPNKAKSTVIPHETPELPMPEATTPKPSKAVKAAPEAPAAVFSETTEAKPKAAPRKRTAAPKAAAKPVAPKVAEALSFMDQVVASAPSTARAPRKRAAAK